MAPSHDLFARPPRPLWSASAASVTTKTGSQSTPKNSTTVVGLADGQTTNEKSNDVEPSLDTTELTIGAAPSSELGGTPQAYLPATTDVPVQDPSAQLTSTLKESFAQPCTRPQAVSGPMSGKPVFLPRLAPHLFRGSDRFFKQVVRHRFGLDQEANVQPQNVKPQNLAYRILPPGLGKKDSKEPAVKFDREVGKDISNGIPATIMKKPALSHSRTRTTSLPSKFQKPKPIPLPAAEDLLVPDPFDYTPSPKDDHPETRPRTPAAKSSFALAKLASPPASTTDSSSPDSRIVQNQTSDPAPMRELPSIDEVFRRLGIADEMNSLRQRLGLPPLSTSRSKPKPVPVASSPPGNLRARLNVLLAAGRRGSDETWERRKARVKKFGEGLRPSPLRVEV